MKDDLISRSALLEAFGEEPFVWDSRDREDVQMHNDWLDYTKLVKEAPAVDAVEVVRCKNCKHYHEKEGWCDKHSHFIGSEGEACHPWESSDWKMFDPTDFCSYGERRADDATD